MWADRFDGERSKLGKLQVEFVSRLANSLGVELVKAESLRAMRERPNNPDAADIAMRAAAMAKTIGDSKSINRDVIDLNERALALDPQNVRGDGRLGVALNDRAGNVWSEDPASDIARAEKSTDRALALQPDRCVGPSGERRRYSSPNVNGRRQYLRTRPRSLTTRIMRRRMRTSASGTCFSAAARTASPGLKPRCG